MQSCLSTERERQAFSELMDLWKKNHLPTATHHQLLAIERAMYRPPLESIASRRDPPIYHAGPE